MTENCADERVVVLLATISAQLQPLAEYYARADKIERVKEIPAQAVLACPQLAELVTRLAFGGRGIFELKPREAPP